MTLMKSLLLGSAAGVVAIASAQAADLPTRKGAPAVEYVRICSITVNGKPVVGWTLPGSDTCFRLVGYITGQVEGGNLHTPEYVDSYNTKSGQTAGQGGVGGVGGGGVLAHPDFGYTTRLNFGFDAVSNTAYGPLVAHAEMQFEDGNGFNNTGNTAYINLAYVTWAGITAGRAPSFFSFTGGGPAWNNFFSPDQQGWNQPDLLAYTASFGGGFSATIAAQTAYTGSNLGSNVNDFANTIAGIANYSYNGERVPDIVGNLKVSQGWGSAQVSGVGHYVSVTGFSGAIQKTWGFGIDAGVSFNLPSFGAGDEITFTGAWSEHADWYSGLPDGMWGEEYGMEAYTNGQQGAFGDTYENPDGTWATPKMWSVSSEVTHHFSPEVSGSLEGGYGQTRWTGTDATSMVSNSNQWIFGGVGHWDPVKNLDFEFELLYSYSRTLQPNGFIPGAQNPTWVARGSGFAARFEVTRNW